jgi:hypothetical protein
MLKTKSFDLMNDAGMNELLEQYPLAEGASIFVSDGKICIPYDDGEAENETIIKVKSLIEINKLKRKIAVVEQSQKKLEIILVDLKKKYDTAEADFKSAPNNKKFEAIKNEIVAAMAHCESQVRQNNGQLDDMNVDILLFEGTL